jgi:hypothetical protein
MAMVGICVGVARSYGSSANDGDGTMSVLPSVVWAATTNNYAFNFRATSSGNFDSGSRVTVRVPAGWTAPQTNDPSVAGFIHVNPVLSMTSVSIRSVSGTGPWTITIDLVTKQKGAGFSMTYFTAVSPANSGVYTFNTQTKQAGGVLAPLATGSPDVTVNDSTKFTSSTLLLTSANPAVIDQSVTFTALVTSLSLGSPTGTVTFRDGDTVLGIDTVQAGVATLTIDEFSHGEDDMHWITAEYSGNMVFNGSVSGTLAQDVVAPAPVVQAPRVNLSFNPDRSANLLCSGAVGQSYLIQATGDPRNGPWTTISTNVIGNNGTTVVTDTNAAQYSSRFYRTVISY